mmetsp:Transcript_46732/g.53904  ORF Transcript_46732/g.53904 Transcript_46732/m.53904 type:complete len:107 (+) Transcript_46732:1508-1828(+)
MRVWSILASGVVYITGAVSILCCRAENSAIANERGSEKKGRVEDVLLFPVPFHPRNPVCTSFCTLHFLACHQKEYNIQPPKRSHQHLFIISQIKKELKKSPRNILG